MEQRCTQYAYLGEPMKLSVYSESALCGPSQRRGYTLADAPPTTETEEPSTTDSAEGEDEGLTVFGKPVAYFQGPILWCQQCWERLREGEFPRVCEPWDSDPTPPEQRYSELLRAARMLFDTGMTDEDKIIPTLAFAARFWEIPTFKRIRDRFAEADKDDEVWSKLKNGFGTAFSSLEALEVVDGVLVVRQVPTLSGNQPL
jgi:hypothetical protein